MSKAIVAFLFLFVAFYFAIDAFRQLTHKDKWSVLKLTAYSIGISSLTIFVLVLLTILF